MALMNGGIYYTRSLDRSTLSYIHHTLLQHGTIFNEVIDQHHESYIRNVIYSLTFTTLYTLYVHSIYSPMVYIQSIPSIHSLYTFIHFILSLMDL